MNMFFRRFATATANLVGSPWAFVIAVVSIVVWAATGPKFRYSDTWQLVINTSTTIVTFLIVFLIQNTQNRDAKTFHLKLDELLRGVKGARTAMVALESCTDEELAQFEREFQKLHERLAKQAVARRDRPHAPRLPVATQPGAQPAAPPASPPIARPGAPTADAMPQ